MCTYTSHLYVRTCPPLSHDGTSAVARSSLIHRQSQRPAGSTCSGWSKCGDRIAWFVFDLHLTQLHLHGQRVIWKTERAVTNKTGYFVVRLKGKLIETQLSFRIHLALHSPGPLEDLLSSFSAMTPAPLHMANWNLAYLSGHQLCVAWG